MDRYVRIGIDGTAAQSGARVVTRSFDDVANSSRRMGSDVDRARAAMNSTGGAFVALRGILGSVSFILLAKEIIQYADAQTLAANRIKLVTKSVEEQITAQRELYAISQRTRAAYSDTADLYSRMARSGDNLNLSQARLFRITETVNKAIVISGSSAESARAAIIQLGQGISSGTLRGEELNSVMEQTPRVAKALADGLGVGIGALRKMGQEGELTAEKVIKALESQSAAVDREYGRMTPTVGQSMVVMRNALGKFIEDVDKAGGITYRLSAAILTLADSIKQANGEDGGFGSFLKNSLNLADQFKDRLTEIVARSIQLTAEIAKRSPLGMSKTLNRGFSDLSYFMGGTAEYLDKGTDKRIREINARNAATAAKEAAAAAAGGSGGKGGNSGPTEEEIRAAAAAVKEADRVYDQYSSTMDRFNAQIRDANPLLTDHEKALATIDDSVRQAVQQMPQYKQSLEEAGEAIKKNIILAKEMADAEKAATAAIKATSEEFKLLNDQWANETPQHGDSATTRLMYEDELSMVAGLQPNADIDGLNEQMERLRNTMGAIPEEAKSIMGAIATLGRKMKEALDYKLEDLMISGIKDPYQQQMAKMEAHYRREKELWRDRLKTMKDGTKEQATVVAYLNALEQQEAEETAKVRRMMYADSLQSFADMTGAMSTALDTSSREGFEASKAFAVASAIMNTAASIMAQTAGPDGWTPAAWARAITVGVIGAGQIAKIMSTSYGGGSAGVGGVTAGYVSGGSSASVGMATGSGMGERVLSVGDSQTFESLKRLADAADNASLALSKVADGLTDIGDLFGEGSRGALFSKGLTTPDFAEKPGVIGTLWTDFKKSYLTTGGIIANILTGGVSGLIGSVFNTIKNGIFGGSWETKSTGIGMQLAGGSFDGSTYSYQKKDGGWFKGDKKRTVYGEMNGSLENALSSYIQQIQATITRAAVVMGTSPNFRAANIGVTNIQTSGRSSADIQKDIEAWFTRAADVLGQTVYGLQRFAFHGESAFDALIRLATSLQAVNEGLELTGTRLVRSNMAGADTAYRLLELMGGAENFADAIGSYMDAMFTDEEKSARMAEQAARQVRVAFNEMGMAVPKTQAEFRRLVEGLNMSTNHGIQLYAALMDIAPAFGYVVDAVEEAKESMADTISSALDIAISAASAVRDIIALDASPEQQYFSARQAWNDARINGRTEDYADLGKAMIEASRAYYGSGSGYRDDREEVLRVLNGLAGKNGINDFTAADRQVSLLSDIRKALEDGNQEQISVLRAGVAANISLANALAGYVGLRPSFDAGTAYVKNDMTADVHQGEIIIDPRSSAILRQYGIQAQAAPADNGELVEAISEQNELLREQLAATQAQLRVLQSGFGRLIDEAEEQTTAQQDMASSSRREMAA